MNVHAPLPSQRAALSVDVEDWFHAENLNVGHQAWDQCELRVERNTMRMLEILERANARATFFVLGWVGEKCPGLVRAIAAAGHEVASHGYGHRLVYSLSQDEFRADVERSKKHLEDLTGNPIRGYRAPCFSITDWAIPVLQEVGFQYDSSFAPTVAHDRYGRLKEVDAAHAITMIRDGFYEISISSIQIWKRPFPWGGGGYFRLLPYGLWCLGVRTILRSGQPYVFYIHPWEIDPDQPRVSGLSVGRRFRHLVNLQRCEARFAALCGAFDWMPLCDLLDQRSHDSKMAPRIRSGQSAARAVSSLPSRPHVLCIGGDDHHLRIAFLLALRDRGFRVSAAGSADPAQFARAGIEYHPFHFERFVDPRADWKAIKAVSELVARVRPHLIHCFDTKPGVLVPIAARGFSDLRIVRTINGLGWLYSSRSPTALGLRPAFRALQRLASRWSAATVFQNRDDHDFFVRGRLIGRGRKLVIPGAGIDISGSEQATAQSSPAELRAALGLGRCEVVITVTRMTREKGIPTLLEAAALVHRRRPGVRFLLVGPRESEGPMAVTRAEIDRHFPYVIWVGQRSDVPALLGLADVFAFPTEYREGVPRALLEAAVAGLPIVATDLPGCRDVVLDRLTGRTVPPRAPKLLAERIVELLSNRRDALAMGSRARQLVKQEFSLEQVVDRHSAVYATLLGSLPRTSTPNGFANGGRMVEGAKR